MKHWKTILAALVVTTAAVLFWQDARSLPATWNPYPSDISLQRHPETLNDPGFYDKFGLDANRMPESLISVDAETTTVIPWTYPRGDANVDTIGNSSKIINFLSVQTQIVCISGEIFVQPHYYGETVIPWWRKPIHLAAASGDSLALSWSSDGIIDSTWVWAAAVGDTTGRFYYLAK